jgi:CheY-like chemotaxis protein
MEAKHATVLVVEDSRDVREMLVHLLQRSGCVVAQATNGLEAIEYVQAAMPDLVLMDISMPTLDGRQALSAIRRIAGGAMLPVVAVTAHAMSGDRERLLAQGFDGYLSKPIHIQSLLDMVGQHIGTKGMPFA